MLTIEEKIELIQNLCKKHDITGYEICKNTKLSASSAHGIITGENNSPRNKTLNKILDYINNKFGSDVKKEDSSRNVRLIPNSGDLKKTQVAEKQQKYGTYFKSLPIDEKLNILHQENKDIIAFLETKLDECKEKHLSLHKQFFSLTKNHADLKIEVEGIKENKSSQSS